MNQTEKFTKHELRNAGVDVPFGVALFKAAIILGLCIALLIAKGG